MGLQVNLSPEGWAWWVGISQGALKGFVSMQGLGPIGVSMQGLRFRGQGARGFRVCTRSLIRVGQASILSCKNQVAKEVAFNLCFQLSNRGLLLTVP